MRFRRYWSFIQDLRWEVVGRSHTLAGGIKGTHVEDVNALHLSDEFQTLKTGGLLDVGGDGTRLGTGSEEVILDLDLYRPTRKIS
jgi:hypothetical protein